MEITNFWKFPNRFGKDFTRYSISHLELKLIFTNLCDNMEHFKSR